MMTEDQARKAAKTLAALATPMRVRMIKLMLEGEVSVGGLADRIGLSQPATSTHLIYFKAAGMLDQRKFQQLRFCTIVPKWADFLRLIILIAEGQPRRQYQMPRP